MLLLLTALFWGGSWPAGSILAKALPALFAAFLRYSLALPLFIAAAMFEKDRYKEVAISSFDAYNERHNPVKCFEYYHGIIKENGLI